MVFFKPVRVTKDEIFQKNGSEEKKSWWRCVSSKASFGIESAEKSKKDISQTVEPMYILQYWEKRENETASKNGMGASVEGFRKCSNGVI